MENASGTKEGQPLGFTGGKPVSAECEATRTVGDKAEKTG